MKVTNAVSFEELLENAHRGELAARLKNPTGMSFNVMANGHGHGEPGLIQANDQKINGYRNVGNS